MTSLESLDADLVSEAQEPDEPASPLRPELVNVNEDPQLSGVLRYKLNRGPNRVGRRDFSALEQCSPSKRLEVMLGGAGIAPLHAVLTVGGAYDAPAAMTLEARDDLCFLNGARVEGAAAVSHGDRLVFGQGNVFYVSTREHCDTAGAWDAAMAELEARGGGLGLSPSRRPSRGASRSRGGGGAEGLGDVVSGGAEGLGGAEGAGGATVAEPLAAPQTPERVPVVTPTASPDARGLVALEAREASLDPAAPREDLRAALRGLAPLARRATDAGGGSFRAILEPVVAGPPPDGRWASLRVRAAVAEDRGARTPRVWSPAALAAALDGPGAGGDLAPTADRAGVACVHLEPLLHLLDIRGALNVADLRGKTVATLDCRVGVAPRGAPGGLAALLGGDVEVTVALALRDLALDAGDAPVLAYQFFDRPLTVALAGVGGSVDHAETFLLPVTPDLLRYVAAEALLVEARLVPAGVVAGRSRDG